MYNTEELLQAVWDDPNRVIPNMDFKFNGGKWQSYQRPDGETTKRSDKSVLERKGDTIFYNYHGTSFPSGNIYTLLKLVYNTNDYYEVLTIIGDTYGIEPTGITEEQGKKIVQKKEERAIYAEIAKVILLAIESKEGQRAREYIESRGLKPSPRMGAYGSNIRGEIKALLTRKYRYTEQDAEDLLRKAFPVVRKDKGFLRDYSDCYNLAFPYYNGSNKVVGFILRQTAPAKCTNDNGEVINLPKYLYSKGMPKGGYTENLKANLPVILLEGILDAEAMKQAGYSNVVAIGTGAVGKDNEEDPNRSIIQTLQRYGAKNLIYIPDLEYNSEGNVKTTATKKTIANIIPLITGKETGVGFISLKIAQLPNPDEEEKQDAASILQNCGKEKIDEALNDAHDFYYWELLTAIEEKKDRADLAEAAVRIYNTIPSVIDREILRRALINVKGTPFQALKDAGITASSLFMIDKNNGVTTYRERIVDAAAKLNRAAPTATTEKIGDLLNRALKIQNSGAATRFSSQINITREQIERQVIAKPSYIETSWALFSETTGNEARYISFAPANISIIAAPTSHGKTLFMLATATQLAKKTQKKFIYISLENDVEQLYIRNLTAYIGDVLKKETNPRKVVREQIKDNDLVNNEAEIKARTSEYWKEVAPYLHFVRGGSDCNELCENIACIVEEWQSEGVKVGGVFIDYIQLLHLPGRSYQRTDELKAICDALNDMAKRTGLPVICGSQMNRDSTNNAEKIDGVGLSNLGESAGIENIAEDCYMLWSTNKVKDEQYINERGEFNIPERRKRSRRIYTEKGKSTTNYGRDKKRIDCLYIESLKAREYVTGCYCLLGANFNTGEVKPQSED